MQRPVVADLLAHPGHDLAKGLGQLGGFLGMAQVHQFSPTTPALAGLARQDREGINGRASAAILPLIGPARLMRIGRTNRYGGPAAGPWIILQCSNAK